MHLKDWRSFERDNWRRNVSAEAGGWTVAESSCTRATDLDFAAKGTLSKVREVPQEGWELDPKICLYKFSELLPFGSFEPMDQVHILKAHYCNSSLFNTGAVCLQAFTESIFWSMSSDRREWNFTVLSLCVSKVPAKFDNKWTVCVLFPKMWFQLLMPRSSWLLFWEHLHTII